MMGWSMLTVLCLYLPVWSALEVIQPYSVVSSNGTAQLRCLIQPQPWLHPKPHLQPSYPDPEELRVTLLKGLHGSQELCSSRLIIPDQREKDAEGEEGEVQCRAQLMEGVVELTVSGLKARDTDMYRCMIEVHYPPPYLEITGNGTLLHVVESPDCPTQGAQRQHTAEGDGDEGDGRASTSLSSVSVPVVVLLTLVVFVLIIIIHLQTLQCREGRRGTVRVGTSLPHKMDIVSFAHGNMA